MRILVTGGLGFIGSNFVKYQLKKHSAVRITNLDRLSYGSNPENIDPTSLGKRYLFVKGDIRNSDILTQLLTDTDAIVNFAAESHVDRSISNAVPFLESNVLGVCAILEAMRKKDSDATLLHVGTDEEFGDIATGSFTEKSPLNPSSPYAASKAAGAMFVLSFARTYGLRTIVTRCTNNFGPNQFPEKLIPKTIIRASLGMRIPIYGSGKNVRDWIFVEDHCDAIDLALRKGVPRETYNISSGSELTNNDLVERILEIMHKPRRLIKRVEDRPGHDLRYSLDSTKIRESLGWKPRHTFDTALRDTVGWYEHNRQWWQKMADSRALDPTPWKLRW